MAAFQVTMPNSKECSLLRQAEDAWPPCPNPSAVTFAGNWADSAPWTYYVQINGYGYDNANVQVIAGAVPELDTYLLMLGGPGTVGVMVGHPRRPVSRQLDFRRRHFPC